MNIENISLMEKLILKAGACQTVEELTALAHENGIDITPEQLPELMAEVAKKCSGELSDDALESASAVGGKASYTDKNGVKYKVVTVGYRCEKYTCRYCKHASGMFNQIICRCAAQTCNNCKYMVRKDGLWLCDSSKYSW